MSNIEKQRISKSENWREQIIPWGKQNPPTLKRSQWFLFVWGLSTHSKIYHSYETSPLRVTTANFDLCLALMTIEQWGFFSMSHLLWHGASVVYNGHLRGPVQSHLLPRVSEWSCRHLFLLPRSSRLRFEHQTFRLHGQLRWEQWRALLNFWQWAELNEWKMYYKDGTYWMSICFIWKFKIALDRTKDGTKVKFRGFTMCFQTIKWNRHFRWFNHITNETRNNFGWLFDTNNYSVNDIKML